MFDEVFCSLPVWGFRKEHNRKHYRCVKPADDHCRFFKRVLKLSISLQELRAQQAILLDPSQLQTRGANECVCPINDAHYSASPGQYILFRSDIHMKETETSAIQAA